MMMPLLPSYKFNYDDRALNMGHADILHIATVTCSLDV